MILAHVVAERSIKSVVELTKMKFSKEQSGAIMHVDGPMMVIAGPGSGKTTVIINRIKYLIESAGVDPADILVITFTKAAAMEMEKRFRDLTRNEDYRVRFGTFHSIFFWIIKTAYRLTNSNIILESEKKVVVERLVKECGLSYDNKDEIISSILSQISIVKCDMIDIENYYSRDLPEDSFRLIYNRLEAELKRMSKIDFDDMMVMCYELLSKRQDILEQCRNIFKYIMVDEFQDSNKIQYEIFKLLANPRNNAFIVGDDDQSVYGFRGARPEIMKRFLKDFPESKQIVLGENHRSDRNIILASASVISGNKNRFPKKFIPVKKDNGLVKGVLTKNENDEISDIVEQIRIHQKNGIEYNKQAVLYRTNNQPRKLVYQLNKYNIPYRISDTVPNVFEHFVARDVLDYMSIASGDMSRARFLRIINKPGRYISREAFQEDPVDYDKLRYRLRNKDYVVEGLDKLFADLKILKKLKPLPALNFIRNMMGYEKYLNDYANYRQMDPGGLIDVLDEVATLIDGLNSYEELFGFIQDYSVVLNNQQNKMQIPDGVNLLTMHSAKGLEFDCVYILDAIEGITPYKKAKTLAELEEERRMFYVAMTRAKHELYMYAPKQIGGKKKEISRFMVKLMDSN